MIDRLSKVRLFVDKKITVDLDISLTIGQAKYLFKVMRLKVGQFLLVIDGKTGEYLAEIIEKKDKTGKIRICSKTKSLIFPPDLWLLFSPLKKTKTDFIIEKATELGVKRVLPIITSRTISKRIRTNRFRTIMVESLEQCGGTYLPKIDEPINLRDLISTWPQERHLIFCDENLVGESALGSFDQLKGKKCAGILIGPEGGFSKDEGLLIRGNKLTTSVTLGPRILRAETAAISAISIWKSVNEQY